jgi:hypothetical protein
MNLTALLLSRLQFAFTISFHIIFPSFSIGVAAWLTVLETLYLATGRPAYRLVFEFWLKIFGLAFGLGVVSGIVMAFEFGTNWSELSRTTGSIQGALLSYETFTAFALEASFFGILVFGRSRVPPWFYLFSTAMVALGVKLQQLTPEMAQALGMKRVQGSIVANLAPGGPAADAGLRPGDVVLHLAGAPPTDQRALLRAITGAPIGQTITLVVRREGKEQNLDIAIKEWPRRLWDGLDTPVSMPLPHHQVPPDLGLALTALDGANRTRFGLNLNQTGVLITGVAPGTDAADHGLEPGNVILRVQETTVSTLQEAQAAFEKARAEDRRFVLVLVAPKAHDKAGPEWITLRIA